MWKVKVSRGALSRLWQVVRENAATMTFIACEPNFALPTQQWLLETFLTETGLVVLNVVHVDVVMVFIVQGFEAELWDDV